MAMAIEMKRIGVELVQILETAIDKTLGRRVHVGHKSLRTGAATTVVAAIPVYIHCENASVSLY